MPSLLNTLRRCYSTVRALRNSWEPISGLKARQGEPGDLRFLRGELIARLDRAPTHGLAGGQQLATGAVRERLHAHRVSPS